LKQKVFSFEKQSETLQGDWIPPRHAAAGT
jgi:hypothetical protein